MTRKLLFSPQVSVIAALALCLVSLLITTQVFASDSADPGRSSLITDMAAGPFAPITSTGWITNSANGHRYKEIECSSFAACETNAISESAHLVTINDEAEQIWLITTFGAEANRWIGYSDAETEGQWKWASGEHSTYTNWARGEPNNYNCDQDHALMTLYFGVWDDIGTCDAQWSSTTQAIIEKDEEPTWIFNPANRHKYKEIECAPFAACETIAITESAHLVTINDQAEQIWLVTVFGTGFNRWIGYTDVVTEGQWGWVSGEQSNYTNWAPGEPNNWHCGEDHAILSIYFGGWNDTGTCSPDFSSVTHAIIEKPAQISLDIGKQVYPDPVPAGAQLTYTIRVTNTGDVSLNGMVTDTLPSHVMPTGIQTWPVTNLAPGHVWTQFIAVTVTPGYSGTLTNHVLVTTQEGASGEAQVSVKASGYQVFLPSILQ
ncbi:hypothetical protein TFLX_00083 [Thermoflexales bacterium]|nr:hypothetical protein TFLX_00083 [Thermoflexales bacterium]